jgi:Tfp pilus assembly protein PilF
MNQGVFAPDSVAKKNDSLNKPEMELVSEDERISKGIGQKTVDPPELGKGRSSLANSLSILNEAGLGASTPNSRNNESEAAPSGVASAREIQAKELLAAKQRLTRELFSTPDSLDAKRADAPAATIEDRNSVKNIFAAKSSPTSQSRNAQKWFVPAMVIGLGGLMAVAWYFRPVIEMLVKPYFADTKVAIVPPRLNPPVTLPAPKVAESISTQVSVGNAVGTSLTPSGVSLSPKTTTGVSVGPSAEAAEAVITADKIVPLLPPPAEKPPASKIVSAKSSLPLTSRQSLANSLREVPAAKDGKVALNKSAPVEIALVDPELSRAYNALRQGNYLEARAIYGKLAQLEPHNLDAHLGLATVAARVGETALATRHYREALAIDPRNDTAIAGLAVLSGDAKSEGMEIRLRTLTNQNPNAANLQFALGNLYSSERRWVEAQQAFFDAFRIDPEQADYAYNLAVSLDQLKQNRLAAEYYQKALNLMQRSGAQFDRNVALKRIVELSAGPK